MTHIILPPSHEKTERREINDVALMERSRAVGFLYGNRAGAIALRVCSTRWIANAYACYLNSRFSRHRIKKFVRRNAIDMSEYVKTKYRSFNHFFSRSIRPERRPVDMDAGSLVSPCDGKLLAFEIDENSVFRVKGFDYSLAKLTGSEEIAKTFYGGTCLIFRLTVTDYHRYIFFDGGTAEKPVFIKGRLHTVKPQAFEKSRVFTENCREYTLLHTDNFGDALQVEVGAMFVGRIANNGKTQFGRGEEKGCFEFGGSTIILVLKKDAAVIDEEILENTRRNCETVVKCGEKIGLGCINR